MTIDLQKAKQYLRVDYSDDDEIIQKLIDTAEDLCMKTLRKGIDESSISDAAILYVVAYLYEHREDADMDTLTKNIRYILMPEREPLF